MKICKQLNSSIYHINYKWIILKLLSIVGKVFLLSKQLYDSNEQIKK